MSILRRLKVDPISANKSQKLNKATIAQLGEHQHIRERGQVKVTARGSMQLRRRCYALLYHPTSLRCYGATEHKCYARFGGGEEQERLPTFAASARMAFPTLQAVEGCGEGGREICLPTSPTPPCQLSGGTLYLGCAVNTCSKYGKRLPPHWG
ncbi:unnamed protein product, partial [Iphiclides podalirius]